MSVGNAAQHQTQFAKDMTGQFYNSQTYEDFVQEYFPRHGKHEPRLKTIKFSTETITNEQAWCDAVNDSGACKKIKFFCTKDANSGSPSLDGMEKARPDIAAFLVTEDAVALVASNFEELFGKAPIIVERKLKTEDGWRTESNEHIGDEKLTDASEHVRGQLIYYAMHQHHQQPRVASYQILLVDTNARIIRFDRAGVVCTKLFDWTDGTILADFFSRFDQADNAQRGYDSTVEPVKDTLQLVKDAQRAFMQAGYGNTHAMKGPFYKFGVPIANIDTAQLEGLSSSKIQRKLSTQMRYFIAGRPISWARSFTGRASTGYICYDLQEKGVHFMKDAWRTVVPSLLAEYEVYARLGAEVVNGENVGPVPNVPRLLCGGDLVGADGRLQKTRTSRIFDAKGRETKAQEYTHFRMVVKEIGKPLSSFRTVQELLEVMRDAVLGHKGAYTRGILHRDISAGNVLIVRDALGNARGLLIDWDLCYVDGYAKADEKRWITGTWQFMSIALLSRRPGHRHGLSDDLESVLWVLCYCLARYTNLYNGPDKTLVARLNHCFDTAYPASQQCEGRPETQKGGDGKQIQLPRMANGDNPNRVEKSDFLPKRSHPAIRHLLSELSRSINHQLQFDILSGDLQRFGDKPPGKDEAAFSTYRKTKRELDNLMAAAEDTFLPTHDNFVMVLDRARVMFTTHIPDPRESEEPLHGSVILPDRVKAHHDAEREKEKAEKDKARAIRDKERAAGKGQSNGSDTRVKSGSGRKRFGPEDDSASQRKSVRREGQSHRSSHSQRSSRREPAEPTVDEETELDAR